ncbi:MAG: peptidylprolyl isomerase [Candidatus Ventricola sp.]
MKKGIALIAMLLAAALMLSGCNLIGYDAELDGAQAVAKVGDTEITKAEWTEYRDYLIEYEQQYMQQYYGMTLPVDESSLASYGELALEQLIESVVIEDKMGELGFLELTEEENAEVEEYANGMTELYKMLIRYQNYPELETVEEEQERLAAEAAEATPSEPQEAVATVTDAMLDAMLTDDLNTIGYSYDYFVRTQTMSKQSEKLKAYTCEGVTVTDEQVKAEFDSKVASQKESYDANPASYVYAEQSGTDLYYMPAGYRGVKNLLIQLSDEKQDEIAALKSELTTAQNLLTSGSDDLEELKAQDTAEFDEETLADYNEQMAALEEQVASAQVTVEETQAKIDEATEAAFAEILPLAQEVLAKAQGGEDFDALVETYGEDTGMTAEPNKTRGYLVCDGLSVYEQSFQDAAMALENVGDVSAELVRTSYGYHILQYASEIAGGEVEYTEEIKTAIYDEMLAEAQDAAYEAAVTQWVSEAKVETFPKVMK